MFVWDQIYRINILINQVSNTKWKFRGKERACRGSGDTKQINLSLIR